MYGRTPLLQQPKFVASFATLGMVGICAGMNNCHENEYTGVVVGRDSHVEISTSVTTDDNGKIDGVYTSSRTVREIGFQSYDCGIPGTNAGYPTGVVHLLHNNDSLLAWKWDSATAQMNLKPEQAYWVRTRGYEVPFLGAYPNIVEYKLLDEASCRGLNEFLKVE